MCGRLIGEHLKVKVLTEIVDQLQRRKCVIKQRKSVPLVIADGSHVGNPGGDRINQLQE